MLRHQDGTWGRRRSHKSWSQCFNSDSINFSLANRVRINCVHVNSLVAKWHEKWHATTAMAVTANARNVLSTTQYFDIPFSFIFMRSMLRWWQTEAWNLCSGSADTVRCVQMCGLVMVGAVCFDYKVATKIFEFVYSYIIVRSPYYGHLQPNRRV